MTSETLPAHTTQATQAPGPGAGKPVVRFRLRINSGDVIAIGPGKVELIEAIGATGSITEAAKSLGMSYRRAWLLLEELNTMLRQPAVASVKGGVRGGGSELTEVGMQLIELYRQIEATAARACAGDLQRLQDLLAR
jgi:molybdate transport system regulatory protein